MKQCRWCSSAYDGSARRKFIAAVMITALLPMLSHAASREPPVILVMGDSLSAGYGINVNNGWVALLGKRLTEQGYGYRIVNASVSGETSGGGKARFGALLKTHQPAIVILELGANDGLRGLPVKQMQANLSDMIQRAQQQGASVVLAGMQMPANYGPAYTQSFAQAFRDLATTHRIALVPFFLDGVALDPALMQDDGLHPNERGQPRLLDNVWAILRTVLKKPTQ